MNNILPYNLDNYRSQINLEDKEYTDWHSKNTIVFGSLLDDGWDWGRNDWTSYSMSEENLALIRPRINEKIEDRYYFRELGVLPPGKFKRFLKRNITEIMSQLGPVYETSIKGIDLLESSEDMKARIIRSEYPQGLLQTEQQDYGSSADENAFNKTTTKNQLEGIIMYSDSFSEPDKLVLEYVDKCFSSLLEFNF